MYAVVGGVNSLVLLLKCEVTNNGATANFGVCTCYVDRVWIRSDDANLIPVGAQAVACTQSLNRATVRCHL